MIEADICPNKYLVRIPLIFLTILFNFNEEMMEK